jgi:hypothetical protein
VELFDKLHADGMFAAVHMPAVQVVVDKSLCEPAERLASFLV